VNEFVIKCYYNIFVVNVRVERENMKKKILLISLTLSLLLAGCSNEEKENTEAIETNGMLSYTIDGESTSEQPSKESGYIVNKILCDSDIDLMWDNDNWEVDIY